MKRVWVNLPDNDINYQYEINETNNSLSISENSTQKDVVVPNGIYNIYRLSEEIEKLGVIADVGEYKSDKNKRFLVMTFDDSFNMLTGSLIDSLGGIESIDSGDRINVTDLQ